MAENDSGDDLVTLAEFRSSLEASLAQNWLANEGIEASLDGASTANWLNYVGAELIGARLSVKQCDLVRAREALDRNRAEQDETEEPNEEEPAPTPPLIRAFRAAVLGSVFLPPLLSIYSLAIVVKHRLWEPQPGETSVDWRLYVTFCFQILGLLFFWWIVRAFRD